MTNNPKQSFDRIYQEWESWNQSVSNEQTNEHVMLAKTIVPLLPFGLRGGQKAIWIITVSKYNVHTERLLKQTKLLKIEDILKLQELKFYYK